MDASLSGPFGRVFLSSTTLTIGRLPDNQLVITDPKTSSRHAEIRPEGNGYTLTDLGSTNGTFVNEQQLERNVPRVLNPGDTVRIGDTRFTYEASGASAVAPTMYANQGSAATPGYDPTVAVPPPAASASSANTAYGAGLQQDYPYQPSPQVPYAPSPPPYGQPVAGNPLPGYNPPQPNYNPQVGYNPAVGAYGQPPAAPPYGYPVPPQAAPRKSNRTLFIVLGSVIGGVVLLCILISAVAYIGRSTPERTLTTFCDDLKSGNYHDAYQQLSSGVQSQGSEASFTSSFSRAIAAGGGLRDCNVSGVSDNGSTGTGTMTWIVSATPQPIPFDATLLNENGTWKISNLKSRA